ncbi:hypothetical protein STAFG_0858 [Streptomyces afghaniensis 772]|uniref:Uncharacterized protein n=1 Tax=Streptomyces afghaniensis 772 TaxID=1283301 RepID=S4MYC4_9ACTN|nr:hypothetical protein STAFG_0858 [Streptomyces afghaniensis 772]
MDLKSKVCVIRTITDQIVNEPYDYIVLAPGQHHPHPRHPGADGPRVRNEDARRGRVHP